MSMKKKAATQVVENCYCPLCGSTEILFEARATWNVLQADWDFHMEGGTDAWCEECGEEIGQQVEWGVPAGWEAKEGDDE